MKKAKIFCSADVKALESEVNEWLSNNREMRVLFSNIAMGSSANQPQFTCYILCDTIMMQEEQALQTLAIAGTATATQAPSVVEIVNPDPSVTIKN